MDTESEVTIIPKMRRVFSAAYASLPTANVALEDLGWATDRLVLYRWSGAAWVALTIHSSSGLAAAIPTAADLPNGSFYYETDTLITEQVQSGAWVKISGVVDSMVTNEDRDSADADGDVAYTGVGFIPRIIIAIGSGDNLKLEDSISWGFVSRNLDQAGIYRRDTGVCGRVLTNFLYFHGNGDVSYAHLKSFDADGFTLTWTKTGTPTGNLFMVFICLR